ncbi:MAG: class I SAM-dependent methyltransferase [bacterium]
MYDEFAHLWTLISAPEDYYAEAQVWKKTLRDRLGPGRRCLLELGVGGGNNLSHLTDEFDATALDLFDKMLDNSRRLNPGVEHIVGDMRTARLGRTFDAVIAHDAISYMATEADLLAAFRTAAAHLNPGGIFVTSPDYVQESYQDGEVHHDTSTDGRITLTHIEYVYRLDPSDTQYHAAMLYAIREGGTIRLEQDHHTFGLFPHRRWIELLDEAGFDTELVEYDVHDDQRQSFLFVGTLR